MALNDVAATTGLRLQVSPWLGKDASIGSVVHETGVRPQRPVWEAYQLLENGDGMALHPLGAENWPFFGDNDFDEVVDNIASRMQELVQVVLWQRGLDPTWPPCPAHRGQHPLWTGGRSRSLTGVEDGKSVVVHDTGAIWTCRKGAAVIRIGCL